MKIRKNGKVVRLTESDLQRIVKRTLNEDDNDPGGVYDGLRRCRERDIKLVMEQMSRDGNTPVTIKSGDDTGFKSDRQYAANSREHLLITSPKLSQTGSGNSCFCSKEEFFAGGI